MCHHANGFNPIGTSTPHWWGGIGWQRCHATWKMCRKRPKRLKTNWIGDCKVGFTFSVHSWSSWPYLQFARNHSWPATSLGQHCESTVDYWCNKCEGWLIADWKRLVLDVFHELALCHSFVLFCLIANCVFPGVCTCAHVVIRNLERFYFLSICRDVFVSQGGIKM